MWIEQVKIYGRLIKFSHTVFALPFALAAVLLAHRQSPVTGRTLFWIVIAMGAARSAAMGFNRFADYAYDHANPRTADRPSVTGQIGKQSLLLFIALSTGLFVLSGAMLNQLCFILSFPVVAVLFIYSYTKRFTWLSHLYLGFAIGLAPVGAWIAATGTLDLRILLMTLALMTYIAGFDILYACQDVDFDRQVKLLSIPTRWGIQRAFSISALFHASTFGFLLSLYFVFDLGAIYLAFLLMIGFLLILEHLLVNPDDMEKIDLAFFHVNSAISVLLFLAVWLGS
jgi:4-hydroxybenzoate polyprenyltransferase